MSNSSCASNSVALTISFDLDDLGASFFTFSPSYFFSGGYMDAETECASSLQDEMARTKQTANTSKLKRPMFEPDESETELRISEALAEASHAAASSHNTPNTEDHRKMRYPIDEDVLDEEEVEVSGSDVAEDATTSDGAMEEDAVGDDEVGSPAEGEENKGLHNPAKVAIRPSRHLYLDTNWEEFEASLQLGRMYQFVIPGPNDTIMDAPENMIGVYKDALDHGLRFPMHPFAKAVLKAYKIGVSQLMPTAWLNINTFIAVCELKGFTPDIRAFMALHFLYRAHNSTNNCSTSRAVPGRLRLALVPAWGTTT